MEPFVPAIPPDTAWNPIPAAEWTPVAIRHLLRRVGFVARPQDVGRAMEEQPAQTVARLFAAQPPFQMPPKIAALAEQRGTMAERIRSATENERRQMREALREQARAAFDEFAVCWLERATDPQFSAGEKFVTFLEDILVVGAQKVRNPLLLFEHQTLLREKGAGPYPNLCKAVSRSAAMIEYLDLQQSRAGQPNENFARELFELFTLGEGNFSEEDVKEAARAFTGYRHRLGQFHLVRREHDSRPKTVFGRTGRFDGDAVIDLVFRQPAAARFLPAELVRFYLTERPLPAAYLEALGDLWRRDGFETGRLRARFFTSRLFHDPALRGDAIKSPVHYYVGLLQDLGLDPAPFPRLTLNALRQMGQPFHSPPNVRGWVGGRMWINASTLAARRQVVEFLLSPLNESRLNADEQAALAEARASQPVRLSVDDARAEAMIQALSSRDDAPAALLDQLFPMALPDTVRQTALAQLEAVRREAGPNRTLRFREALLTLFQAPHYHLC